MARSLSDLQETTFWGLYPTTKHYLVVDVDATGASSGYGGLGCRSKLSTGNTVTS